MGPMSGADGVFHAMNWRPPRRHSGDRAPARMGHRDQRRCAFEGDAEQISINLRAAPSYEAFGRALEARILDAGRTRLAVLVATHALMLSWTLARSLLRP